MPRGLRVLRGAAGLALVPAMVLAGGAQAGEAAGPDWKLTLGRYHLSADGQDAVDGTDLNLRWRHDGHTAWVGVYRDAVAGRQWRAGWDDQWALGAPAGVPLTLLPSLQTASGGFWGGSLALQGGDPVTLQLGWGRTNLRPYANLNFDPNDAVTVAVGWQGDGGRQVQASVIADDRLHTGQQHRHLTLHWPLPTGQRLSADLLRKRGQGDGGWVQAWGWSLGVDGERAFVRLAHDPKQNFSVADAWRLSGGWRF